MERKNFELEKEKQTAVRENVKLLESIKTAEIERNSIQAQQNQTLKEKVNGFQKKL